MLVPGSNILNMALSVIGKQSFQYLAFKERVTQPNGNDVATYNSPMILQGSIQPVQRTLYVQLGLDLQRNYINVYVSRDILDITRDVSGDQIIWNCKKWQCLSKTAWSAIDGWDQVLCVQIPFS